MVIRELVDGKTTNFSISYQSDLSDALGRAKALKTTCDIDFERLRHWFGIKDGFGPSNRVKLIIDKAGYGSNSGYRTDGSSSILINAFDGSGSIYADDAVRAIFVGEMAEILMSYNIFVPGRSPSWQPLSSDGEGLSRVAAAMLYKDAYYKVLISDEVGPPVNKWLSGSRADWISKRKLSDLDVESYGCSILFIYYLYSQLGYSMESIVSRAGESLDITYHTLTGKKEGYKAFTELLSKYYPIDKTIPHLPFDNPFPLLDGMKRTIYMNFDEQTGTSLPFKSGTAKLKPYHASPCPVKEYKWTIENISQNLICTASVSGFGQPIYKWRINEREINTTESISINAIVYVDNPDDPYRPSSFVKDVKVHCSPSPEAGSLAGILNIYNEDHPGHIDLNFEVEVKEAYASTDVSLNSATGILDSQKLTYEEQYYKDRDNCEGAFQTRIRHMIQKVPHFVLLLTKPDPPPDLVKGIRALVKLNSEISKIAIKKPGLAHQISISLAHNLNVPKHMLLVKRKKSKSKSQPKKKKKPAD